MLDDLVSVIETLQRRIRDHGASLRENETRTRMALIDPLLTALGWDVSDPAAVTPEYNVSGRWADYALLRPDGQPAATIEAKKLGESLASHRMQMLNYSNASGVEYAGLTDGDRWEMYEVFQRGQLEDRRILDVSIANTPAHELALKLLLLWKRNLVSGGPVVTEIPIVVPESETGPVLDEPVIHMANQPTRIPTSDAISLAETPGWITLESFNHQRGELPPMAIRFPDGHQSAIGSCTNMLVRVAEWLASSGSLTSNNVPVQPYNAVSRTRGTYIINTEPRHLNGNDFRTQHHIENTGLVLNATRKPRLATNYAKALLQHCGIDPATVQLHVG